MKKSMAALALALVLAGTLTACSNRDPNASNGGSTNAGANSGVTSGTNGSAGSGATSGTGSISGTPGTVSRRYGGESVYNGRTYFDDGRYTAGSNGQVYGREGGAVSRDLTRDARDIVRDAGDAIGDIGRGIGDVARDVTGAGSYSGTPSWEPDSSAVRY